VAPCWRKLFDRLSLQCKQAPSGVILEQRDPGTTSPVSYITYAATVWRNWIELNRRCSAHCGSRESIDVFDIYTIIFLALAVFIFLRLRSVLGQRTGRERPPYDPYSAPDPVRNAANDKVIPLPPRTAEPAKPIDAKEPVDRYAGIAPPGSAVARGLDAIVAVDNGFDAKHFVTGARSAYEMIVTAYAEGDRRALKDLLAREVFDGFDAVIREREGRGETAETRFVSIDVAEITAAELRGKTAQITLRFVSQLVSATRDRSGNVIDGSADKVTSVTDVWTFARDVTSRDPNWKLVATEAGG
jgi:predicted lipid-binding transport protein (Tim44 family)